MVVRGRFWCIKVHTYKVVGVHHQMDVLHQLHSLLAAVLQRLRCELPLNVPALPAQRSACLTPSLCAWTLRSRVWHRRHPKVQAPKHANSTFTLYQPQCAALQMWDTAGALLAQDKLENGESQQRGEPWPTAAHLEVGTLL